MMLCVILITFGLTIFGFTQMSSFLQSTPFHNNCTAYESTVYILSRNVKQNLKTFILVSERAQLQPLTLFSMHHLEGVHSAVSFVDLYVLTIAEAGIFTILFDQPWNQSSKLPANCKRAYNWYDILQLIKYARDRIKQAQS